MYKEGYPEPDGYNPPKQGGYFVPATSVVACAAAEAWAYWNTLPIPPSYSVPINELECPGTLFVDCTPQNGHPAFSAFCVFGQGGTNFGTIEFDTDANQIIYYGWEQGSGNPAVFTYPMSPESYLLCADIYGPLCPQ